VTGLSLVDNRGGGFDPTVIRSLANGATLDLNLESLPTRILNVRADAGGAVGSVRLSVDGGKVVRVRNAAPYALFGDNDAPGGPGLFTPGEHTVAVTPFRGRDATGAAGATQTFRFRVRDTYEDGTGFALFVDLDSDGSTADEAPTGNQDDDQENTGNETRTQAFFRNNGSAPLTLEGDLTFFPGDGEQDDSGFFLGLPSLPNLGDAADQEDDLLYLDANDFTVPQGARGAVYGFFRTTPGGGRLSDRVTLAAGESLSFDVINDGDGGRNKAGVSPAPKSPKPKKFGGFS
jgi:hypothetical protein